MMANCIVQQTTRLIKDYFQAEEYCSVCRRYYNQILEILSGIENGTAISGDLDKIKELAEKVIVFCQCQKGLEVAQKILHHLQQGIDEFLVHINNRVCPAGECVKLVLAPCQAACPAGLDIPNYVALVGMEKFDDALSLIREDVPLPGSLGRICEHPCQQACRRATVDEPISICALKRVAYDGKTKDFPETPERRHLQQVAVVGAGPAGLAAAYFLAKQGYGVTMFESMSEPGGMLAFGIPPYRLPRKVLRDEIERIKALGVEIKVNSPINGEQGISNLFQTGFSAVFLGTGAWQGSIPIAQAEQYQGVYDGVTFLREINQSLLDNETPRDLSGQKVVVVGGGNVAIDAARVSLRLGAEEVRIVYRRTKEEMPALKEEIVDAEHEGILFDFLISPVAVGGEANKCSHLVCLKNELSQPDASGRRKPVPVEGSEYNLAADIVIFATGQKPDVSYLASEGVEVDRNRITVDPLSLQTSLPGVFAGGDAVTGPASAIKAMAAGKQAAAAIDAYLQGKPYSAAIQYPLKRKSIRPIPVTAEQKAGASQVNLHDLYMAEKKYSFEEIMQVVSKEAAIAEASRCLRCDLCIACGNCVDSCHQQIGVGALQLGYVGKNEQTDFLQSGEKCIGCTTCAVNCPTGAITCDDHNGFREMRMCGGLISRLELLHCESCGQPFTTQKHFNYINNKQENDYNSGHSTKKLCQECSRMVWSKNVYGARMF